MAQVWKRYTWINNHLPFWANLTSETCQIFLCETMNSHQMNVSILFTFKLFTTHVTRSVEMQLHVSVKLSRKYYCILHISMVNDHRGFNELHQEVWHHQGGWGHSLNPTLHVGGALSPPPSLRFWSLESSRVIWGTQNVGTIHVWYL